MMKNIFKIFAVVCSIFGRVIPSFGGTHGTRDFPIYAITDIHMNSEPLKGITKLTDGIVIVNGDIVTGVTFDKKQRKLGSKHTYSIRKTLKGTWTDPQTAIDILKTRTSPYPLIVGLGNHELNPYAYNGSSIKDLKKWIQALLGIGVIPLCTFPNYTSLGAERCYRYGNTYFLSYLTSEYGAKEINAKDRNHYESAAISSISWQIQQAYNTNFHMKEVHLMLHAGFDEGKRIAEGVIRTLENYTFDTQKVYFICYLGHAHGESIPDKYRHKGHKEAYWKGYVSVPVGTKEKNIRFVFPNCADDCIRIDTDGTRSLKARFITKSL
ncbi:MAG: metallophosphoesterase [Opitutales bacterium]|nr:metallophosphoesterase [Opitutales bacterium]